jgi:SPP1 family phage portal protein
MHDLTPKQYEEIWESGAPARVDMQHRQNYYDGTHAIIGDQQYYVDGSPKSQKVANFIKYGIDLYVGSVFGDPASVTALETGDIDEAKSEAPTIYREIGTPNNFDAIDPDAFRTALIKGWGIETHEFIDDQIVITPRDPMAWHPVWNSAGEFIGLVHRSSVAKGEFVNDVMIDDELQIMVVYNTTHIKTFHKSKGINNGQWYTPEDQPDVAHHYGEVPAVLFRTNSEMASHITNDLIAQNDEYNDIDSGSGDDIRGESEGVLVLKGYSAKDIQDNAETIRQFKLLPLPADGDAHYVNKGNDEARVTSRLNRTRANVFMALAVPDIKEIVGATGSTSGIALQLKFKPMADNAAYMIANMRVGIRDRIRLINARLGVQGKPMIENVQVNIQFSLPTNRAEEWQNIGSLTGIVSHRRQLEILSDVVDADEEEKRLLKEGEDQRFTNRLEGTPEEIAARNNAQVGQLAIEFQPQISTVIDAISDAAIAETLRRASGS